MDNKFEIYKLAFEYTNQHWEMLWQKIGHYLVANSAFLFIVGLLHQTALFALVLSLLGLLLSLVWIHSNYMDYDWNRYWIRELRRLEKDIDELELWTRAVSAEAKELGRPSLRFDSHGLYISGIFVLAWTVLTVIFLLLTLGVDIQIAAP